jgi:3-methyladenine DNA glycosylase/8-oxoguanine DNA glycosylase
LQADSILDNQIEVKMIDEIKVYQLYGDLRFITYILLVLPEVVGQPITPRWNAFEMMMRRREQLARPAMYIASGTYSLRADQQLHNDVINCPQGGGFS